MPGVDGLFFAGTSGRLMLKSEDRVMLYDQQVMPSLLRPTNPHTRWCSLCILTLALISSSSPPPSPHPFTTSFYHDPSSPPCPPPPPPQARKVIAELQVPRVKYVVWNKDYSCVALISKHQLVLANKQLEQMCTVTETVRLKGGCWDNTKPVFIYTTLNHVKYLLLNGDRGIVRGLDAPVYVTKGRTNTNTFPFSLLSIPIVKRHVFVFPLSQTPLPFSPLL